MRGIWRNQSQFLQVLHQHTFTTSEEVDRKILKIRQANRNSVKNASISLCMRVCAYFLIFSAVFSWAIDNCFEMFFGEGWNSMSSLPPFQTLRMTRGYFNNQSANKTEKKAEDLKFEIWFADNRDVHMRLQIFKVSLKMLMSYFYESRSCMWGWSWDIRYDNRR